MAVTRAAAATGVRKSLPRLSPTGCCERCQHPKDPVLEAGGLRQLFMKLPPLELATSRRAALLALSAIASVPVGVRRAHAIVDGIPLYAPGDQIQLPEAGFETFLPQVEQLCDSALPMLKELISVSDYDAAARFVLRDALSQQLDTFGNMASILGDEAYTAVGIKSRYRQAAKQLQAALIASPIRQDVALKRAGEMQACANELRDLVPDVVVRQVREREKMLAAAIAKEAPPPPLPSAEAQAASRPSSSSGSAESAEVPTLPAAAGLPQKASRDAGRPRCGIDIRC